MAAWPTTLPPELPEDGFSLTVADNLIRSNMDIGPPKVRRRTSSNITKVEGTLLLSNTELATFEAFYITTLSYGALQFDWVHPITNVACEMRFSTPPKYSAASGDYTQVTLNLEILP